MKILKLLLALSLIFAVIPSKGFAESASNGNSTYTKDQQDALKYLNNIRAELGLTAVKMNPYLTKAAANHVAYLYSNTTWGHNEIPGEKGFTGVNPTDRFKAVGGEMSAGEVLAVGLPSSKDAVRAWLNTAYHRSPLINPNTTEVGIAYSNGIAVINMTTSNDNPLEQIAIFPYDQMKDVKNSFNGVETPNPLQQFKIDESGYIISFQPNFKVQNVFATLKDSKGNQIPLYVEGNDVWYFFPSYTLAYGEKYTVEVSYSKDENPEKLIKKWSFTTQKSERTDFTHFKYYSGVKLNNRFVEGIYSLEKNAMKYLPAGKLLTRLNYVKKFDKKSKTLKLVTPTATIVLKDGSLTATKNNKTIKLKNRPIYQNGDLFIPASIFKDLFGITMQTDQKKNIISVSGKVETMTEPTF